MSLLDALLLEPHPLEVWLAVRTDGISGSGTESDPFNASPLDTPDVEITSLTASGAIATATVGSDHGLKDDDWVTISGVYRVDTLNPSTGTYTDNNNLYCGTFQIKEVGADSFQYVMLGIPSESSAPGGSAIKCWRERERFDAIMRVLPENTTIHLGPGVFHTKGYSEQSAGRIPDANPAEGAWQVKSGQKILGSGISVTTLKLVGGVVRFGSYRVIGSSANLQYVTIADLTIDCNIACQDKDNTEKTLVAHAIFLPGSHHRIQRVRAINFGPQIWGDTSLLGKTLDLTKFLGECFVIATGCAHPVFGSNQPVDCVVEDCIIEQPGMNNARETTCIIIASSEEHGGDDQGIMAYPEACVIRNCYFNLEYLDNPIAIAEITVPDSVTGLSTVTTRQPHGMENPGKWIRISGAIVTGAEPGEVDNGFNGSYQVASILGDCKFTYYPADPVPDDDADPSGDMWLGRFPSALVGLTGLTVAERTTDWLITVTTMLPHFLIPGSTVQVGEIFLPTGSRSKLNGARKVTAVVNRKSFQFTMAADPETPSANLTVAFIGANFQGMSGAQIFEGNRVFNCNVAGPYHDTWSQKLAIVRNNHYRNVFKGQYHLLGGKGPSSYTPLLVALATANGLVATITTKSAKPHGLALGQGLRIRDVTINNGGPAPLNSYNGWYRIASIPSPTSFTYLMKESPGAPGDPDAGAIRPLWQNQLIITENNVIELTPSFNNLGPPAGITLFANPEDPEFIRKSFRVFRKVIIRGNIIRFYGHANDPAWYGDGNIGISVTMGEDVVIENNMIDLDRSDPLQYRNCTSVFLFNNTTIAGQPIAGALQPPLLSGEIQNRARDLSALVDSALVLSML